ncbi:MAG: hypothetical protein HQ517_16560 [SAR324 cluster bacterium]|nr:hypothetical protein [SAR324 cluster bacterium]
MTHIQNPDSISESSPLLTDFYQLTMAYGFWKAGMEKVEGTYHLFFRSAPFNGNYCICCGLEKVISFIENLKFEPSDLIYLASLQGNDGERMFEEDFLDYLQRFKFVKARVENEQKRFHPTILRLVNPHQYPVGNEKRLNDVRTDLVIKARKQ